jgi:hypothetical protein
MSDAQDKRVEAPGDPSGIEPPHDVLAAEEFVIGTREERVPSDPTGIAQPHDVLAAEEFAMPSPEDRSAAATRSEGLRGWLPLIGLALVVGLAFARRRRR